MESFDQRVAELMTRWQIPGGAVGVVKDGRLVYMRGFGWADSGANEPVQPQALFRIASVSKPITSVTVLKLVEEGRLSLDDKAFSFLTDLKPPAGATGDPRLADITIRELLQHAGGWNRDTTFDPMFISDLAAQAVGAPAPASCETVIRYMLGQPLQFTPGTQFVYSNFGYCVLGRIIERVTKQRYEDYVKDTTLAPLRVSRMHLGRTHLTDRAPGEVHYYDYPGAPLAQSVFAGEGAVPWPYGGFYLEAMDAHGRWLATTIDLLRFLTAADELASPPDFLQPTTMSVMLAHPLPPLWADSPGYFYAMGWYVGIQTGDAIWWHSGSLPGTWTLLWRGVNGVAYAALFNSRPADTTASEVDGIGTLAQAADEVTQWPSGDLFEPCGTAPAAGCQTAAPRKASLVLKDSASNANDTVTSNWVSPAPISVGDFADPMGTSEYTLCVYDQTGGTPTLKLSATVAGGATSAGKVNWKATKTGFQYADAKAIHDGLSSIQLKAGSAGKGKIVVKGKGVSLRMPNLPLTVPVTVQMKANDGSCWGATFSTPSTNDSGTFNAKSDG